MTSEMPRELWMVRGAYGHINHVNSLNENAVKYLRADKVQGLVEALGKIAEGFDTQSMRSYAVEALTEWRKENEVR
jgi:hypothetical protein